MEKLLSNKKLLIGILTIIVLVALVAIFYYQGAKIKKSSNTTTQKNETNQGVEVQSPQTPQSQTAEPVPENVKVPEKGESVPEGVAAPEVVTEAAPGVSAKFRSFDIKAENNKFNPSTVIVRLGDTVHINFTAQDKDYDITFPDYGMKQTAKKGETKILEFQALIPGKFTFYCELCGGLNSTAKGYIIVSEK
jgi:plastocyanin